MEKLAETIRREYSTLQAIYRRGMCPFSRLHARREYLRGLIDSMRISFGLRAVCDPFHDSVEFVDVKEVY